VSAGVSLRRALRDFYANSWRLVVLNLALGAFLVVVVLSALWFTPALILLLLVGPLAAGLMHCAVTIVQTEGVTLGDALAGVRLHWRRGLVLGIAALAALSLAGLAVPFYAARGGWGWALALVALYVAVVFGVVQMLLWPLAILEFDRPLLEVARESFLGLLRRPAAGFALALALLAINVAGIAAGVIPFLTLTVAYSFLAAAHFALPRSDQGGTTAWPA
jgi:hypothetical protein